MLKASSPEASARMRRVARRDTPAELRLRSELHGRGFRYRVDAAPLAGLRRRADLVFRGPRVAVFVDGCFWHGCPRHMTWPTANAEWWRAKIERNRARDRDTDRRLEDTGWTVVRVWEHEDPRKAADRVADALRDRGAR
jgi:DNA mismatch endonuclease, patch repair protein